jgi:imidazolonepropionase-like amidohydrolase
MRFVGATLLTLVFISNALAQPSSRPARRGKQSSKPVATSQSSKPTTTTTTQAVEKKDRFFAVIHGRVHTVTGAVHEDATVLCKNGKIVAIGSDVQLPLECEVLDATGRYVYPGLVAASASGLHGSQPEDNTDVFALRLNIAVAAGITTAIAGNTAAKLTFGSVDDMIVRRNLFTTLKYTTRDPLARAQLRADLERVRGYLRDLRRHEIEKAKDKDAKPPDKAWLKGKYDTYRKLMQHEAVAVASANRAQELLVLAELVRDFDIRLVIRGAYEGWLVAPQLARAGVSVVLAPRTIVAPDERYNRPTGSSIENAHILRDHGITVAIAPRKATTLAFIQGVAGQDLLHLNLAAAFAVRGGMRDEDALKTITIDAARVLGIDDRVGSLEVGKDADLLVCDGDLLHYMTLVNHTIVNGRVVYDKAADSLFAHIRPKGKPEAAQFDDQWPRRLAWPEEDK